MIGDYPDLLAGLAPRERKRWIYRRFVKDYYRAVCGVDEKLGRVLDHLDQRGWPRTRLSLRVPLVPRYPRAGPRGHARGRPAGRVEERMALNIDFAPTILDFAGVPIPATMQGVSLRPLIEGRVPARWRTSIYYTYFENSWLLRGKGKEALKDPTFQYFTPDRVSPHRGVRTTRHKLIEYYSEGDYWELFDLQADPHELKNLYGEPGYAAITAELKHELARLRAEFRDV